MACVIQSWDPDLVWKCSIRTGRTSNNFSDSFSFLRFCSHGKVKITPGTVVKSSSGHEQIWILCGPPSTCGDGADMKIAQRQSDTNCMVLSQKQTWIDGQN